MVPQSNFLVLATVTASRRDDLEKLLESMNLPEKKGMADPQNPLVPFGRFDTIHFARFVIIDDQTLIDFAALGMPVPKYPVTLAFLGDCDGPAVETLAALAGDTQASAGLRNIFSHCEDFSADTDLVEWMTAKEAPPAAAYVNWLGRTVKQVKQENLLYEALRRELQTYLSQDPENIEDEIAAFHHIKRYIADNPQLLPERPEPASTQWQWQNRMHFAIVPAALIAPWLLAVPWLMPPPINFWLLVLPFAFWMVISYFYLRHKANRALGLLSVSAIAFLLFLLVFPFTLLLLAIVTGLFLWILRCHEKNEPEVIPKMPVKRMDRHLHELASREDHDITNQFTVVGSVKPGIFRRWLSSGLLWLINYGARHLYNRGHIGRIQTIHFARWTFMDDKRRLIFASNYDGSHEAYMDDFINKVGWGLNLAFGGGVGYPRVNWLIANGAKEEDKFKYTLRRHQLPTQVWYKAYPGLTAADLARNSRVHQGIIANRMSAQEIRQWFSDL